MATNPYIRNWDYQPTQSLIEDLLAESIAMAGVNTIYLPRTINDVDKIFGEPGHVEFKSNYIDIEMYVTETEMFGGEGELLSKFGVEVRDSLTFWVSAKRFNEETDYRNLANTEQLFSNQPREGDLVYIKDMQGTYFQVMFVENKRIFFAQGSVPLFELACEKLEYSGETFSTGNTLIDAISTEYPVSNVSTTSPDDTEEFKNIADQIVDFSEDNPFSELF